jgi:short-subunit dehydrogenase
MARAGTAALITGASSGISAAFAGQLARRGHDLILVARRRERLEQFAARLSRDHGIGAEALAADLSGDEGVGRVESRIAAAPNLELVVNGAGFGSRGRFWEADDGLQDRMYRVHVLATMRLTRAALRAMMPRDRGAVINVSSVAGFGASPGSASYASTKAWMNVFTESLALELASAGSRVKVQALCPGFTLSEFHDVIGVGRGRIPRSWWMTAEEVAAASLRGLERGRIYVIPGLRYRAVVALEAMVPGAVRRAVTRVYARWTKHV